MGALRILAKITFQTGDVSSVYPVCHPITDEIDSSSPVTPDS